MLIFVPLYKLDSSAQFDCCDTFVLKCILLHHTEDAETITVELDFSQHITTLCPQLNLLSLVNETELTNGVTLTASLSASGAVQVTLSPSTTEIAVMEVMTSTITSPTIRFTHTSVSVLSTPLRTMATGVTQSTNDSFYIPIAMGLGAALLCFITITISCTVIISCYCRRAKTQRTITNSMEPPMFPMVEHTYSGIPNASFGIYDFIKAKDEPLPDLPDDQPYEIMKPAASVLENSAQTKTFV